MPLIYRLYEKLRLFILFPVIAMCLGAVAVMTSHPAVMVVIGFVLVVAALILPFYADDMAPWFGGSKKDINALLPAYLVPLAVAIVYSASVHIAHATGAAPVQLNHPDRLTAATWAFLYTMASITVVQVVIMLESSYRKIKKDLR